MAEDPDGAREIYAEYWVAWDTLGGDHHEGILFNIDNNICHVLCTDGVERET